MYTVKIQFVLWVAMETVRLHIAQMSFFLEDILFFPFSWSVNNLTPMRNCPGGTSAGLLALLCRFSPS